MAKQLNDKLQDLIFRLQGKRVLQANWVAVQIDDLYLEAWQKAFAGSTAKAKPFRGITKKVQRIILGGNDSMFKTSWMETWKGTVTVMPKTLVAGISGFRALREVVDEDDVPGLPETTAQARRELSAGASLPRQAPKGFEFAKALYSPPTQKAIDLLNLKSEWQRFLNVGSNETEIVKEITKGVANGQTNRQVARSIKRLVGNDKTRATRIARTEMQRVNIAGQEQSIRSALGKTVGAWKYMATLDSRTRPHHAAQDGKVFDDNKTRPLLPDGPNCRCTYSPITKSSSDLEKRIPALKGLFGPAVRASMNGAVPGDESYSSWFGKQSAKTQKGIIGPGNFKRLSRNGKKVQWSSFTRGSGSSARRKFDATVKGDRSRKGAVRKAAKGFAPV